MNLRKGLTRIWIAGSCLWVALSAFAAYEQHKPADINPFLKHAYAPPDLTKGPWTEYQALNVLSDLLIAADKAGDTKAATIFAKEIRRIQSSLSASTPPTSSPPAVTFEDLIPPQRWDAARIGAFLSAVLTNGVLPAALGYAGLFLLMWVTRWIVAGFKGT
jgi:hypothetical protein